MFLMSAARRPAAYARSLDRLLDDRFFDRLLQPSGAETRTEAGSSAPALDVHETDTAYTARLDMPGVDKADVKIAIEGRRVTVEASAPTATTAAAAPVDGERALYTERGAARYARSFVLPTEVDQASSTATMANGVLTLSLAKRGASQPANLTVN